MAFEITVHGRWHDEPFRQALWLVFVVGANTIQAFGEYLAWPGGLQSGSPGCPDA